MKNKMCQQPRYLCTSSQLKMIEINACQKKTNPTKTWTKTPKAICIALHLQVVYTNVQTKRTNESGASSNSQGHGTTGYHKGRQRHGHLAIGLERFARRLVQFWHPALGQAKIPEGFGRFQRGSHRFSTFAQHFEADFFFNFCFVVIVLHFAGQNNNRRLRMVARPCC